MRLACSGLFSWFEKKATIVTPSPFLAGVAAQQFANQQLREGSRSWSRPSIYSIEARLVSFWQEARYSDVDVPALLSPAQERTVWQHIIEREHSNLFDLSATARLAQRAATLIAEWEIPSQNHFWAKHEDARQFQHWRKLFRRKCKEEGWIARSDLWHLAPEWIAKGIIGHELTVFVGFDTLSPALDRIKSALGLWAAEAPIDLKQPIQRPLARSFDGFNEEIEFAARWARAIHEWQPSQSIAVLVPDLRANRSLVERIFAYVFYPSAALGGTDLDSVYHITAGLPLQNHALVANALLILELGHPRIHHADAGAILRSPFVTGAEEERSARALADLELRKRRELDLALADLERASKHCKRLGSVWSRVRRVLEDRRATAALSEWSRFVADLLGAAGWPGDRELTANEQIALDAWNDVLASLETLGLVMGPVTYEVALNHLRRLLASRSIETGDQLSPIQILDHSEAHCLEFDAAMITGLSDEFWPPPQNLSPLIPIKLIRMSNVPGGSPQSLQRDRDRATKSLFGIAPELAVTYSGRLSPLAEKYVGRDAAEIEHWGGRVPWQSFVSAILDQLEDGKAPAYRQPETTRGGTSIIKSQSQCPFRAFAEFRLGARGLEDACFGFDSRDRGGFLHKALELVWNNLKTHTRLLAMPGDQLRLVVRDAVFIAVAFDDAGPLHQLTSTTERERLEDLILEWLAIERTRKHPFTVEIIEQERYYEVPGLRLRLRVDRIDRLKNGQLLLIDYKSGPQTRGKLKCPRPPEPQLFVYAASLDEDVAGVFLAQLKPRELKAVGYSNDKYFPGQTAEVRKDWNTFLETSRLNIHELASDFVAGKAVVNPIDGACEYCALKPLCRVNEQLAEEQSCDS